MEAQLKDSVPEGYVKLSSSGILLRADSPAVAAIITKFLAKRAAAAARKKARRGESLVIKGFAQYGFK
jgi:hypothetical protein